MKIDFEFHQLISGKKPASISLMGHVASEAHRLTDVALCAPRHLAPVPCCAVTRSSLRNGFEVRAAAAAEQHEALVALLEAEGVRCHMIEPVAGLPDMSFTRDVAVATPFGMFTLNPAMSHRRGEVDAFAEACRRWQLPIRRIADGTIEGGDVCVAREGLLIVGMSGERSSAAGVTALSAPFRAAGWDVLVCPFHANHLHLDTIFCMVDRDQAIGCLELLDTGFAEAVRARGISILPVPTASSASLGCNVLSLGDRRIVASAGDPAVADALRSAGYQVMSVDVSQFTACGGGIHCLTQPIRRVPN